MTCSCELVPQSFGAGGGGGGGGNGDTIVAIREDTDSSTTGTTLETLYSRDMSDIMVTDHMVLRGRIVLDSTSTGANQGIDWQILFDGNAIGFLDQMVAGTDLFIVDYEIARTSVNTIRWSVTVFRLTGETYSLRLFTGDDIGLVFSDETLFEITADASAAGDVGILRSITGLLGPVA